MTGGSNARSRLSVSAGCVEPAGSTLELQSYGEYITLLCDGVMGNVDGVRPPLCYIAPAEGTRLC
jgi:hypothetical protein